MDTLCAEAARAAEARAADCRERRARLASRHRVGPEDVAHARRCLAEAAERAVAARLRLERSRLEWRESSPVSRFGPQPQLRSIRRGLPDEVRRRARNLPFACVLEAYLTIGGNCTEFELDAFIYAGMELPEHELTVLDHVIWELTEFGG